MLDDLIDQGLRIVHLIDQGSVLDDMIDQGLTCRPSDRSGLSTGT